jgi:hypothetical protein
MRKDLFVEDDDVDAFPNYLFALDLWFHTREMDNTGARRRRRRRSRRHRAPPEIGNGDSPQRVGQ